MRAVRELAPDQPDDAEEMIVSDFDPEAMEQLPESMYTIYRAFEVVQINSKKQAKYDQDIAEEQSEPTPNWPYIQSVNSTKSALDNATQNKIKRLSDQLFKAHGCEMLVATKEYTENDDAGEGEPILVPARVISLDSAPYPDVLTGKATTGDANFEVILKLRKDSLNESGLPDIAAEVKSQQPH